MVGAKEGKPTTGGRLICVILLGLEDSELGSSRGLRSRLAPSSRGLGIKGSWFVGASSRGLGIQLLALSSWSLGIQGWFMGASSGGLRIQGWFVGFGLVGRTTFL